MKDHYETKRSKSTISFGAFDKAYSSKVNFERPFKTYNQYQDLFLKLFIVFLIFSRVYEGLSEKLHVLMDMALRLKKNSSVTLASLFFLE